MKTNLFSILCPEIKEQHLTRINLCKFLVGKIRAKEKPSKVSILVIAH